MGRISEPVFSKTSGAQTTRMAALAKTPSNISFFPLARRSTCALSPSSRKSVLKFVQGGGVLSCASYGKCQNNNMACLWIFPAYTIATRRNRTQEHIFPRYSEPKRDPFPEPARKHEKCFRKYDLVMLVACRSPLHIYLLWGRSSRFTTSWTNTRNIFI